MPVGAYDSAVDRHQPVDVAGASAWDWAAGRICSNVPSRAQRRKRSCSVCHAVEQPEPRKATAEEASLLGIQKSALVTHIRRTYYSDQGRPVETADIVVPAAHCEIVYEIPINR
ncbi:UTRA domain-containing protein [Streptomyces sp. NPDC018964]|uniref:UTRA domain-containing protein n=1 Tax=Streptomyces sp. NPDC018964 TaxID=3365058 RepID=UPI0037A86C0F